MRVWRCVAAAVAAMAMLAPAAAQERRLRVLVHNGMELVIDRPEAGDTREEILAALRAAWFAENNGGVAIQTGVRAPGEDVIRVAAPYFGVARLENDVFKSGAFGGRVLVFPRGTILFQETTANPVASLNQRPMHTQLLMFCGARPEPGALGACLVQRSSGWEVSDVRSPTPYVIKEIGPGVPVDAPQLVGASASDLPERVSGYRFDGWTSNAARLTRYARVGDVDVELGDVRIPLRDGVATTQIGTLALHLRRGEDRSSVLVDQSSAELIEEMANSMFWAADRLSLEVRMDQ